jgi:AcrR family transcriptional regulator
MSPTDGCNTSRITRVRTRQEAVVGEPKRGRGRPVTPGLRTERRKAIVASAYAVLTERGYDATSISDIARHAGVGQGTVYRYFENKRELLDHVFDYAVAKTMDVLDVESVPTVDAADGRTIQRQLVDTLGPRLFALVDQDPAILRLITVESSAIDPELRHRVIGILGATDAELTRQCARANPDADPDVNRETFARLGRMLVAMIGPGLALSIDGGADDERRAAVLSTVAAIADGGLLLPAGTVDA